MEKICSLLINLPWKLHIIYILIPWQHFVVQINIEVKKLEEMIWLLTKKERKQVCQYLALSFLSKLTKVVELLIIRCLAALISSRIETMSAPD